MTDTFRALCEELVEAWDATADFDFNDFGHAAADIVTRARAALAQPEPVPVSERLPGPVAPTDEQTFELADDLGIIRGHGGDLHVSLLDLTPFAESVLTRWGTP